MKPVVATFLLLLGMLVGVGLMVVGTVTQIVVLSNSGAVALALTVIGCVILTSRS